MNKLLSRLKTCRHSYIITVISSSIIGIYYSLGSLSPQVCTETGMVLSGMIKYPDGVPYHYYNVKVFSLINQVSALLVLLTQSPAFADFSVSLLKGILSCTALALVIFAFCRNYYISIGALFFIIKTKAIGEGIVYPIWLYETSHTYGVIGLSFMVLILGLFGCRKYKWALACTGLAPAVHPSWGIFMALILGTAGLLNLKFCWMLAKKYWKYFAVGFGISLAALALQMYWMRVLPSIDAELKKQYLDSFIRYWDFHRKPFDFSHRSVRLAAYCTLLGLSAILLLGFRSGKRFALGIIIAAGAWGFAGAYISHLPHHQVPLYILMFMPGRFINLSIFLFPVLSVGLLFSRELFNKRWSLFVYAGMLLFWFLKYYYRTFLNIQLALYSMRIHMHAGVFIILSLFSMFFTILICCRYRNVPLKQFWRSSTGKLRSYDNKNILRFLLITFFSIMLICTFIQNLATGRILSPISRSLSYRCDNFYKQVSLDRGILLNTSEGFLISLRTKRPVWFDMGALDGFPMVPECAKTLEAGMREIYGVSLLEDPGEGFRNWGTLPGEKYRALWEGRPREEWHRLAGKYNFSGIIVPETWKLHLSRSAENNLYAYYNLGNK